MFILWYVDFFCKFADIVISDTMRRKLLLMLLFLCVVFAAKADRFRLVTAVSQLKRGDVVTFVSQQYNKVASVFERSGGYIDDVDVVIENNEIDVDSTFVRFTLKENGNYWNFVLPDGSYLCAASSSSKLESEKEVDDWAQANIEISDGNAKIWFKGGRDYYMRYSPQYDCFKLYYEGRQADMQLYRKVNEEKEPEGQETYDFGTLSGYFTYVTRHAIDFHQTLTVQPDLRAFKVVAFTGETYAMVQLGLDTDISEAVVPKDTPVLLYSATGGKKTMATSTEEGSVADNLLRPSIDGSVVAKEGDAFYILQYTNDEPGWWRLRTGKSVGSEGMRKAYLDGQDAVSVLPAEYAQPDHGRGIWFFDEQIPAGISSISVAGAAGAIYDITGRRVLRPLRPGVYVVDGKKVIVAADRPAW